MALVSVLVSEPVTPVPCNGPVGPALKVVVALITVVLIVKLIVLTLLQLKSGPKSANSGHIVIVSDISIASGVSNDISFGGNINSFGGNHVFINKMAAP